MAPIHVQASIKKLNDILPKRILERIRRIITPEGAEPVGDTQREAMLFAFARVRRW